VKLAAEPLTRAEVNALLAQCSRRAPTGIRNRALITVLYRTGLRIFEALALQPKDVDLDNGILRVLHGKGNKQRTVGLDSGTIDALTRWLEVRAAYVPKNGGRKLFCTLEGQPVQQQYVRNMLRRIAAKAGVEKRVHPHGFRHTHAAELVQEHAPMTVIRDQLGHASLATTDRYLRSIAPEQVIDFGRNRDWT
jgi:site-specific recombinase XerD